MEPAALPARVGLRCANPTYKAGLVVFQKICCAFPRAQRPGVRAEVTALESTLYVCDVRVDRDTFLECCRANQTEVNVNADGLARVFLQ